MKLKRLAGWLVFHAAAALAAGLFVLPLLWAGLASLRQPGLPPPRTLEWWPSPTAWSNYTRLFELLPFGRYTLNSLLVAGLATPLSLITASWAGLGMALLGRRARRRLAVLSVGLLLVPLTAVWLTRFLIFRQLGWIDSYAALLAPALMGTSPLFVLLFYSAFRRLPGELYDSARLDGAGALSLWFWVVMPAVRPTSLAVAMLAFLTYWSDFINPLMYLKSQERYTLAVGLQQLQQLDPTNWPLLMAGAVLMMLPALLLFVLIQRFFLKESPLAGMYGS